MIDTRDRTALLEPPVRPPLRAARSAYAFPVAMDSTPPPGRQPVASDSGEPPPRGWRWVARLALPAAVALALLGPLLAWLAHDQVAGRTLERRRVALDMLTGEQAQRVRERILAYSEALHMIRGLFEASQEVTPDEFATFTRDLRLRHPAVRVAAWAPRGRGGEDAFDTFVVQHVQPDGAALAWYGLDLAAEPAIARAISRTLGSHEAVLTDAHPLRGAEGAPGVALVLHVPAGASVGAGGVILLGLDGHEVVASAAAHASADAADALAMQLLDADVRGRRAPLGAIAPSAVAPAPELTAEAAVHVAGQDWRVLAAATPRLLERVSGTNPWLAALLAFLAWELFVGSLVGVVVGWRGYALRGQARMTGHVLRNLGDAVVVTDRHGHVRLANPAAKRLLAASLPEGDERLPFLARLLDADAHGPLARECYPLTRALAGEVVELEEARLRLPGDAEPPHLALSARPLLDELGALHGAVMVLRDMGMERAVHEAQSEMRWAGEIQRSLYPRSGPDAPGLDVSGAVLPAAQTCGDYYDWLSQPDGRLLLAVGDVSGHGAGPAILMAEVCAYVRGLAAAGHEPADILRRINAALVGNVPDEVFVSLLLVSVDPVTRRLSYASAGHPAGLLLGADGEAKAELEFTGPMLGKFAGRTYRQVEGPSLDRGDVLTLLTDGVTELPDPQGEMFGEEGVWSVVRASRHERAADVVKALQSALEAHGRGRATRDDVTLVVVKG